VEGKRAPQISRVSEKLFRHMQMICRNRLNAQPQLSDRALVY